MVKRLLGVLGLIVISTSIVAGSDFSDLRQDCPLSPPTHLLIPKFLSEGFIPAVNCVLAFFQAPIGPDVKTLAPDAPFAIGVKAGTDLNWWGGHQWQDGVSAEALGSLNHSSLLEVRFAFDHPAIGQSNSATRTIDARASLNIFARRYDFRDQPLYALGPNSPTGSLAYYRQQQNEAGVQGYYPLLTWLGVVGATRFIDSTIKGPHINPDAKQQFASVPGMATQDRYLVPDIYLVMKPQSLHALKQVRYAHTLSVGASMYHDLTTTTNSFRQITTFASGNYELRAPTKGTRSVGENFLCMQAQRNECTVGTLLIDGIANVANSPDSAKMPFYLQPTLGGTDRFGLDTLRGLTDDRLRAPNRMLLQAEFDKDLFFPIKTPNAKINIPFGMMAFYDVGKVAMEPGGLAFSHTRHDLGIGVYVKANNKIIARLYMGFGTGEGNHIGKKFMNALPPPVPVY
jgi:hypothetical protein